MTNQACAHLRVEYRTESVGGGAVRGHWECDSCGGFFWPSPTFPGGVTEEIRRLQLERAETRMLLWALLEVEASEDPDPGLHMADLLRRAEKQLGGTVAEMRLALVAYVHVHDNVFREACATGMREDCPCRLCRDARVLL